MEKEISLSQIVEAISLLKPYDYNSEYRQKEFYFPQHSDSRKFIYEGMNKYLFRAELDNILHFLNVLFILYPEQSHQIQNFRAKDLKNIYDEFVEKLSQNIFDKPLSKQKTLEHFIKSTVLGQYDVRAKAIIPMIAKLLTLIQLLEEF